MCDPFRFSRRLRVALIGLMAVFALPAAAVPTSVTSQDSAGCDVLSVPALVEELGNPASPPFGPSGPFPSDSAIASTGVAGSGEVICDGEQLFGPVIRITNLTSTSFDNVWYVGDASVGIYNFDGLVNGSQALKIDTEGGHKPLVAESIAADGIFAPGEAWDFVLAAYDESCGYSATYFGSIGVGSPLENCGEQQEQGPPDGSTGSIIATAVPEPGTLGLLALGLLALVRRDRRR